MARLGLAAKTGSCRVAGRTHGISFARTTGSAFGHAFRRRYSSPGAFLPSVGASEGATARGRRWPRKPRLAALPIATVARTSEAHHGHPEGGYALSGRRGVGCGHEKTPRRGAGTGPESGRPCRPGKMRPPHVPGGRWRVPDLGGGHANRAPVQHKIWCRELAVNAKYGVPAKIRYLPPECRRRACAGPGAALRCVLVTGVATRLQWAR